MRDGGKGEDERGGEKGGDHRWTRKNGGGEEGGDSGDEAQRPRAPSRTGDGIRGASEDGGQSGWRGKRKKGRWTPLDGLSAAIHSEVVAPIDSAGVAAAGRPCGHRTGTKGAADGEGEEATERTSAGSAQPPGEVEKAGGERRGRENAEVYGEKEERQWWR